MRLFQFMLPGCRKAKIHYYASAGKIMVDKKLTPLELLPEKGSAFNLSRQAPLQAMSAMRVAMRFIQCTKPSYYKPGQKSTHAKFKRL